MVDLSADTVTLLLKGVKVVGEAKGDVHAEVLADVDGGVDVLMIDRRLTCMNLAAIM